MRRRFASLLYRWGARIEGHRAEHRAGEGCIFEHPYGHAERAGLLDTTRSWPPLAEVFASPDLMPPDRRESRGWNS